MQQWRGGKGGRGASASLLDKLRPLNIRPSSSRRMTMAVDTKSSIPFLMRESLEAVDTLVPKITGAAKAHRRRMTLPPRMESKKRLAHQRYAAGWEAGAKARGVAAANEIAAAAAAAKETAEKHKTKRRPSLAVIGSLARKAGSSIARLTLSKKDKADKAGEDM